MGKTIIEKILSNYSNKVVRAGDIVTVEPEYVMSHDNSAFIIKKFYKTGYKKVWNKNKIIIIYDHAVPAELPAHIQNHKEGAKFAAEQELPYFFADKKGVCHQVMMEEGFVMPGTLVLGADSHSTLYGALNAAGIPINRTEMAGVWATGKIWLKVPNTIKIILEGNLSKGVYSKDIMLKILSILKNDGAQYKSIEFSGSTVKKMSMSSRMTLTNMAVEIGAKCAIMPYDKIAKNFLLSINDNNINNISSISNVNNNVNNSKINIIRKKASCNPITSDSDAKYEKILKIDVTKLEPQISLPHQVDNVKSIINVKNFQITQGYLGSCTNGRIEDLKIAAKILKNKKISKNFKLYIYPSSKKVEAKAKKTGIYDILINAGCSWMATSCGPCMGVVGPKLSEGQSCISSSNRNFCGRMGSDKSFVYLASPAVVAASAINAKITDPRNYL